MHGSQGVLYNKDIFEKYDISVPQTKRDMEKTVQLLEEKGITPFAGHFMESWKIGNLFMQLMIGNIFMDSPRLGGGISKRKSEFF